MIEKVTDGINGNKHVEVNKADRAFLMKTRAVVV
jgi:hypothetical protein